LVAARYPWGVVAVSAVTAGYDRGWWYAFLFAAFFTDHSDKRVEVDRQLQRALVS
jgi:hypothetical protein